MIFLHPIECSCNQHSEMIYNLYMFNPLGQCLYYGEWERTKVPAMSQDEEFKLVYGMLYSLKSFVSRITPAMYPFKII